MSCCAVCVLAILRNSGNGHKKGIFVGNVIKDSLGKRPGDYFDREVVKLMMHTQTKLLNFEHIAVNFVTYVVF